MSPKTLFSTLACAAALCAATAAQASLVTFNQPGLIDIDPATNAASYTEAGFTFTGDAASFLPLDGVGSGATGGLFVLANSPLTLRSASGGAFSLAGFDFGLFDLLDTTPSPSLVLQGLLADSSTVTQTLGLGSLPGLGFAAWDRLLSVSFSANTNFVLDNVSAVPEPGSLALVAGALAGLGVLTRRRPAGQAAPLAMAA